MNTHADKTQENKSNAVANTVSQKKSDSKPTFQFADNRAETIAQKKLQEIANNSPQAKQAAQLKSITDNHLAQQQHPIQKKENNTGLPDNLKSGIENLSGYSMDDVKVHYNSDKPAQLHAHAYAQGTDIHLASGQEKHLPHEAWHVVQQKQGRVKPTMQMKGKVNVNDDAGLEKEADVMGAKALQMKQKENKSKAVSTVSQKQGSGESTFQFVDNRPEAIAQRKLQEMANKSPQTMQMRAFQQMAINSSLRREPSQKKNTVIQRVFADGEPKETDFDNSVIEKRVTDMSKSLIRNGRASLLGNYGKDYADGEIYESRSGAHVEQQIFDDYVNCEDETISIYTERAPCKTECSPMIKKDDRIWDVKYTVPTGVLGRAKIYKEIKTSLAEELFIKGEELEVDEDMSTIRTIENEKVNNKTKKAHKKKAKEKRRSRFHDDEAY